MRILLVLFCLVGCGAGEGGTEQPAAESLPSPWEDPTEVLVTPGQMTTGPDWAMSEVLAGLDTGTRIGMLVDLHLPSAEFWIDRAIEVRGFDDGGVPTKWLPVEVTFSETHYVVARAEAGMEVVAAQLRLPSEHAWEVTSISLAAVIPASDEAPTGALEVDRSALSLPSWVTSRTAWNAKPTECTSWDPNKWRMAIHHTFTPASSGGSYAARIRSIQAYHMDVRGWCDIGYHFLVTEDGSVWEGRPINHRGAHVGNSNSGNIGVSFVGCFEPGECSSLGLMWPTQASLGGAGDLIGHLADEYGIAIDDTKVKLHRDHAGASTTCPGDNLAEKIPTIFALAKDETEPEDLPEPEDVSEGRIMGVVWDVTITDGPADPGVVRLDDADVSVADTVQPVKEGSGYWEFIVPPGVHTVTASAPGYETGGVTVTVSGGAQEWASIGLTPIVDAPVPAPGDVTIRVTSAGAPIADSLVHIPDVFWRVTDDDGEITVYMPAGPMTFTAYGAGYTARTLEVTVAGDIDVDAILQPAPTKWWTGEVKGVVWDATITDGPNDDGNVRLDDAMVVCTCGLAVRARTDDAFWSFDVSPGEYTFVADTLGYHFASTQVAVSYQGEEWASIGLAP